MLYSARMRDCRKCPKLPQCQLHREATTKPRRISLLLHPLQIGPALLPWQDWSCREHRRACQHLVRDQQIGMGVSPTPSAVTARSIHAEVILSRAQRAHTRLSWAERLARNARPEASRPITIKVFGVPAALAAFLGLQQTESSEN